jgi:hypothetical protein
LASKPFVFRSWYRKFLFSSFFLTWRTRGVFESKSFVCQLLSTPNAFYDAWAMFLTDMSYQSLAAFLPPLGALFIAGQCHGGALVSTGSSVQTRAGLWQAKCHRVNANPEISKMRE